jgi:hypothetical protein
MSFSWKPDQKKLGPEHDPKVDAKAKAGADKAANDKATDKPGESPDEEEESTAKLIHWEADVDSFVERVQFSTERFTRSLTEGEFASLVNAYRLLSMSEQRAVSNALSRAGRPALIAVLDANDFAGYLRLAGG